MKTAGNNQLLKMTDYNFRAKIINTKTKIMKDWIL